MTPIEILACARTGDVSALGADRAAVADAVRSFANAGDAASALEVVGRAWRIWLAKGELAEGSAAAEVALAAPGAMAVPIWRARALYADGVLAFRAGDEQRSRKRNQEALDMARAGADVRGECDALTGLARLALRDGAYDHVIRLASEARERARKAGDPEAEAAPLHLHAAGLRLQGHHVEARDLYLKSLDLNARLGNRAWVAMEQHNLGWVELHLGNIDSAMDRFRESDAEVSDAYGRAWSDLNWAAVAVAKDDRSEADRRYDLGTRSLEALGVTLDPDDQYELNWLRSRLAR